VGSGTQNRWHVHNSGKDLIHIDVDKHAYHLEVVCDAHYLPFVENTFKTTYLSHILEHLYAPLLALYEARYVTNGKVIVKVPNASYYKGKPSDSSGEHLYSWNKWTLHDLLSVVFDKVEVKSTRRYAPIDLYRKIRYARFLNMVRMWFFHLIEQRLYGTPELTGYCR
jgi:hypothetical protein